MDILTTIRNWAEIWPLFLPLFVILIKGPAIDIIMRPIVWYTILAIPICLLLTTIFNFYHQMPPGWKSNNILYNMHSVLRVFSFSFFIWHFTKDTFPLLQKTLWVLYLVFVVLNFAFFESLFRFSSRVLSAESVVLLTFVILYFIKAMKDESEKNWAKEHATYIVFGIGLYEAANFFIFLFYYEIADQNWNFGKFTWTMHHITFIILCTMIAIGLYRSSKSPLPKAYG